MADGVRTIAALPDPAGEVIDGFRLPNGLDVRKVRVPLGVVAVVYEARPNVTIDAAALCLKAGNAIVLRGSSAASRSNAILAGLAASAVAGVGLPEDALGLVSGSGREEIAELATQQVPEQPTHLSRSRSLSASAAGYAPRTSSPPRSRAP